jgi:hypothetical protein
MLGKLLMVLTAALTLVIAVRPAAAQLDVAMNAAALGESADSAGESLMARPDSIGLTAIAIASHVSLAGPLIGSRAAEAKFSMPGEPLPDDFAAASRDINSIIAQDPHLGKGKNVAFMVVGGAAIVTGLFVGGDAGNVIAAGGAVIGLYGLYMYVR